MKNDTLNRLYEEVYLEVNNSLRTRGPHWDFNDYWNFNDIRTSALDVLWISSNARFGNISTQTRLLLKEANIL